MNSIFKKELSLDEFKQLLLDKSKTDNNIIEHVILNSIETSNTPVKDLLFRHCELNNINAEETVIQNTTFDNCIINNAIFENSQFDNVTFLNSKITNTIFNNAIMNNVKFINCEISYNTVNSFSSFKKITANPVSFHDSKLHDLNFYEAEGVFKFDNSELAFVNIYAKNNSSIEINKSIINTSDFSDSSLDSLIVTNSSALDSKANDSTINTIFLENNIFDRFPIVSANKYGTVVAKNTSGIAVHGSGPVQSVSISDCSGYKDVYISKMIFDYTKIENCSTPRLTSFDVKGKKLIISNMDIYKLNLNRAEIEHLILNNVKIEGKIFAKDAQVKIYEAHNVTVDEGVIYKDEGANFKIITTK